MSIFQESELTRSKNDERIRFVEHLKFDFIKKKKKKIDPIFFRENNVNKTFVVNGFLRILIFSPEHVRSLLNWIIISPVVLLSLPRSMSTFDSDPIVSWIKRRFECFKMKPYRFSYLLYHLLIAKVSNRINGIY